MTDIWVRKVDAEGQELWVRNYNSTANGWDYGAGVATDTQDNVIVVGHEDRDDLDQLKNIWIRTYSP